MREGVGKGEWRAFILNTFVLFDTLKMSIILTKSLRRVLFKSLLVLTYNFLPVHIIS